MVVVESENLEKNRQFVERLGAKARSRKPTCSPTSSSTERPQNARPQGAVVRAGDDLKELRGKLTRLPPVHPESSRQTTNLVSLFDLVNSQFRTSAAKDQRRDRRRSSRPCPCWNGSVKQANDSLQRPGTPPSPGITRCSIARHGEEDIYITFAKARIYLVTAQAKREDLNGDAVDGLRELVAQTELEVPGVNVGVTGEPVLDHDEMVAIAERHHRGEHRVADYLRVDFHLRLPGNRPAAQGDVLPDRRAGVTRWRSPRLRSGT